MPTQPFITPDRRLTLSDILGYCQEFKRHHGRWPHVTATEADFLAAGMQELSGAQIERALRTSSNGLGEDPEFQVIRFLAFANGGWDVNIQFIDPEHRKHMPADGLQRLFASMHLHPAVGSASFAATGWAHLGAASSGSEVAHGPQHVRASERRARRLHRGARHGLWERLGHDPERILPLGDR